MTITVDFTEAMQRTDDAATNRRVVVMALRQLARLDAEGTAANDWMASIMDVFNREGAVRTMERQRLTAVVEEIAKEMLVGDSKHVDIPGMARIQFKTTDGYLRVADHEKVIAWATAAERTDVLERVPASYKVLTNEAKQWATFMLETSGEIIDGFEKVEAVTTMKIETAKEARSDR